MRTDKVDLDYLKRYRNPMLMTLEILILPARAWAGLQQTLDCIRSLHAGTKPHFDFQNSNPEKCTSKNFDFRTGTSDRFCEKCGRGRGRAPSLCAVACGHKPLLKFSKRDCTGNCNYLSLLFFLQDIACEGTKRPQE